jgi:S1-C subfamily serine protease
MPPRSKYITVLAVIAASILILGAKFKPQKAQESVVSQADALRLQLSTQRRNLEQATSYFARVAGDVSPGVVWVSELGASGIVWEEGHVVSTYPARQVTARPAGQGPALDPDIVSIHYPSALLRAKSGTKLQTVFHTEPDILPQGSWILEVVALRDGGHRYIQGTFGGVINSSCGGFSVKAIETNLPLDKDAAGAGVFDIYGNLAGVVLNCGEQYRAVTTASAESILEEANTPAGRLLRRYGLRSAVLTPELAQRFKTDSGMLVTETWEQEPADQAGVSPGDVIKMIGEAPVREPKDLEALLHPSGSEAFPIVVWRRGRNVKLTLPVKPLSLMVGGDGGSGIVFGGAPPGYLIEHVVPGSRAEAAGLAPGDRLLEEDGQLPRNVGAAEKVLSGETRQPVYVVIQRGRKKLGVYLR